MIMRRAAFLLAGLIALPAAAQNATIFAFSDATSVAQLVVQTSSGALTFDQASTCTPTPCAGQGWYGHNVNNPGAHNAANLNYIATISGVRDYFVFDVSLSGGTALSAYLHLWNPGGVSSSGTPTPGYQDLGGYPSATYMVWDITSPLDSVMASNSGGTSGGAIWDDLGSGVNFGSRVVSALDNGSSVDIALNSDAVSAINQQARIGFGGSLVAAVPEPQNYAMLLIGIGILVFVHRSRRQNAA
jgi:hypothetical protein